jgi:surfeit locus 1 family protein
VNSAALRRLLIPGLFAAAGLAVLVSLGVWQLQRLAWKEALIARVESRLGASPVAAPGPAAWPELDLTEAEYQPVTVSGRFLNADEIHVVYTLTGPKGPAGGIGYLVMTPFETDGGWVVYVNRGFVPRDRKDPATRQAGEIEGVTTVVGLLRQPSARAWFTPADNPARNEWFSRDPTVFAAAKGLPAASVAPYVIDAKFDPGLPGGLPQGGETIVSFPNNHLQYAVTWFGLALALIGVFAASARSRLRTPPR